MRKTGLAALLVSIGSVKREVFMLLAAFCLLVVSYPFSGYAAGPDGFANVPWGATRSQVDQAMAQQGFSSEGEVTHYYVINDGSRVFSYDGTLAGADGHATFWFLNDTFTEASSVFIMRTVSVVGKNVRMGSSLPSFSRNTARRRNRILPAEA